MSRRIFNEDQKYKNLVNGRWVVSRSGKWDKTFSSSLRKISP
jgi:hypothetical protein